MSVWHSSVMTCTPKLHYYLFDMYSTVPNYKLYINLLLKMREETRLFSPLLFLALIALIKSRIILVLSVLPAPDSPLKRDYYYY